MAQHRVNSDFRETLVPPLGTDREYVVVHEMLHLIEPPHSERFLALMSKHYPGWREARAELNELPRAAEVWKEHD